MENNLYSFHDKRAAMRGDPAQLPEWFNKWMGRPLIHSSEAMWRMESKNG